MKKLFYILLLISAAIANAQVVSITGNLNGVNGAPAGQNNYLQVAVVNCGSTQPTVNGVAVMLNGPVDFYPGPNNTFQNADGTQASLYGNDAISCGNIGNTSRYSVTQFVNGSPAGPTKYYYIPSGVPFNINTAQPISVLPPLKYPNPTQCPAGQMQNGLNNDLSPKCINLPTGASNAVVTNPVGSQSVTLPGGTNISFGTTSANVQINNQGSLGHQANNCSVLGQAACENQSYIFNGLRSDTTSAPTYGQNFNTYWLSPGWQLGNIPYGPGLWTSHQVEENLHSLSSGNTLLQYTINHTGAGDTGIFIANVCYGGAIGASDQGCYGIGPDITEPTGTYNGTVVTGGSGVTQITTTCTADCGNQGQDRTLINLSRPVTSGFLTAHVNQNSAVPAQLTISSGVSVSTAWGLLQANVSTPRSIPTGVGTTSMTFAVNISSALGGLVSPGQFNVGDLVCFGGGEEEQAKLTAVSAASSGSQSITANLRNPHPANTWIMANGACGTYIDLLAAHSQGGLRYPVPVIGSTTSNVLQTISFGFGGPPSGQSSDFTGTNLFVQQFGAKNFSNGGSGTTVTMNLLGAGFQNIMRNAPSIWISGSTDSAINGACTNVTYSPTTQLLSCTKAGLTGSHITTDSGVFALSSTNQFGNGDFVLYPGASVLDVQNETASAACNPALSTYQSCLLAAVDGTFTLEPNNISFSVGDLVQEPHHYTMKLHGLELFPTIQNPGPSQGLSDVIDAQMNGPMTNGISLGNQNSTSMYQYFGGMLTPPNFILTQGLWTNMFKALNAPQNGGAVLLMGPVVSGDTDANYSYDIFSGHSQTCGQAHTLQLVPSTDTINLNCQKFNINTSLLFSLAGTAVATITPSSNGIGVNGSVAVTGGLSTAGNLGVAGAINVGMMTNQVRDSFNFGSANWTVTGSPTMTTGQADGFGTSTATKIVTTGATTFTDGGGSLGASQVIACAHVRGNSGGETLQVNAYGFTGPTVALTTSFTWYCSLNTANIRENLSLNITIPGAETIFIDAVSSTILGPSTGNNGAAAWTGSIPTYLPTTGTAQTMPVPVIASGNSIIQATKGNVAGQTPSIGGSALSLGCTNQAAVTVNGAQPGMVCTMSGTGGNPANVQPQCSVTAANTVIPQLCTAVAVTPAAQTYDIRVIP